MNWVLPASLLLGSILIVFGESTIELFRQVVGAQPDLLAPLVVYAALSTNLPTTIATALTGGLAFDALSSGPPGLTSVPLTVLGVLLHRRREVFLKNSTWAQMLLGGASALAVSAASVALLFVLWPLVAGGGPPSSFMPERREGLADLPSLDWGTLWQLVVVAVGGAIGAPVIFRVFRWVEKTFHYPLIRPTAYRPDREIQRRR